MIKNKKILAIIPARGGSKRLPRKNVKLLNGKPLIAYTVESALKSRYLDRIIVSTEDGEIRDISKKYGAEVMERPKRLASDTVHTNDVYLYVLEVLRRQGYKPDILVILHPTSPLRTEKDIDEAIKIFSGNKTDSLVGVCAAEHPPYWSFKMENKYLEPLFGRNNFLKRSQDLPQTYVINGAIYISTVADFKKYKTFYLRKIMPYVMPGEKSIDIDTEIDFKLTELLIKNEKNKQ